MSRILPKLRPGVRVETKGTDAQMTVELAVPGGRGKRVSGAMWGAIALLDAFDDVDEWKRAAREREPTLTDASLDKLLAALEQHGFAGPPGAEPAEPAEHDEPPEPSEAAAPAAPPTAAPTQQPPAGVEVSDLMKRPALNAEITQISTLPMRPPMVRRDIKAQRTEKPGMVRVMLPGGGRYDMPEREYRILLEFDGIRDLETIHAAMAAKGAPFSFEQLAMFVAAMTRQGLVTQDTDFSSLAASVGSATAGRGSQGASAHAGSAATPKSEADAESSPELERGMSLLASGDWALAEQALSGFLTTNPGHQVARELLDKARAELVGAMPTDGAPVEGAADATADVTIPGDEAPAPDAVWDEAQQRVTAEPDVGKRRVRRRLLRAARVLALPFAAMLVGAVVKYPLKVTYPAIATPLDRFVVRAPKDGVVGEVLVEEGETVPAGHVLGRMADADQKSKVIQIRSELEKSKAELELLLEGSRDEEVARVRARVGGLSRELSVAKQRRARVASLVKSGVAPRSELEQVDASIASLSGDLAQAGAELRLVKAGSRPDEIKKKEAEVRAAEAKLGFEQQVLEQAVLRTSLAGTVTTTKPKNLLNARMSAGDVIFEVASFKAMRAEIMVNERDFDVLKPGLQVVLKVASHPTEAFPGTITRIAPQVETLDGQSVIRVEARVDNERGLLVPNMSGYAEINAEPKPVLSLAVRRILRWVRVRFLI
ncbi:MAG: HlyD family efflux transporter periplasmic adaptor subunit [Deltaproteobacteria bacterium]|nr:HlyD family efflux transporter periplasmic adaptor subunit [Deltaproteobacteria bacterium]